MITQKVRVGTPGAIALAICVGLLAVVSSTPDAAAQVPLGLGKLEIGVKGGLTWAGFSDPVLDEETSQVQKFTAGAFIRIPLTSIVSIQPELAYVSKGSEIPLILTSEDYPEGYGVADYRFRLDYIEFSPMIRLTPHVKGPLQPSLVVGPCFGYNVLAKTYLLESEWDVTNASDLTVGIEFGAMLQLNLAKPIFVDVRYSMGLSDAYDLSDYSDWEPHQGIYLETPVFADVKNNVISVTAGMVIF